MIKKIKIILINRPSMSDPSLPSRSSSARLYTLLTYLQKKNIVEFKMVELNDITLGLTKKYDFFLFNKHFTEEAYDKLRLINELGKITIYDIDDYLFKLPSYSVTKIDSVKIEIISNLIIHSKLVLASGKNMKEKILKLNNNISIVETGFDHERFGINAATSFKESYNPVILLSNTDNLKIVKFKNDFIDCLNDFIGLHPNVQIHFRGDIFPDINRIKNLVYFPFLENYEYKKNLLNTGYWFGLVPLGCDEDDDDNFIHTLKTPVKFIDYSSLGIPSVYSKNKLYNQVEHMNTGYLVNNNYNEWFKGLEKMILNRDLRENIRINALNYSIKNFSLQNVGGQFMKILNKWI